MDNSEIPLEDLKYKWLGKINFKQEVLKLNGIKQSTFEVCPLYKLVI